MSYRFVDSCLQTCMTYTIAKCTVNKLLMRTEELPKIRRVSCQNKFVKLVHLVGFIIQKFVMMHGHTNVKKPKVYMLQTYYLTYFRLPAFLWFCVIVCRKWPFDGPMSHPMNPNRSIKITFLKPTNLLLCTGP